MTNSIRTSQCGRVVKCSKAAHYLEAVAGPKGPKKPPIGYTTPQKGVDSSNKKRPGIPVRGSN